MALYTHPDWYDLPYNIRPSTQNYRRPPIDSSPVLPPYEPPPDFVFDYNDPYVINSIADLVVNQSALDKHIPKRFDIPGVDHLVQRIEGLTRLTYQASIKPIAYNLVNEEGFRRASGFYPAIMNLLQNFTETIDILANPIKGALMTQAGRTRFHEETGLTSKEAFRRGIGDTEHGRPNWDWDWQFGHWVPNLLANVASEFLSDPLSWVTLGKAAALKKSSAGLQQVLRNGFVEASVRTKANISSEGIDHLVNNTLRIMRRNNVSIDNAAKRAAESLSRPNKHWDAILGFQDPSLVNYFAKTATNVTLDHTALEVMRMAHRVGAIGNAAQIGIKRSVSWSSGIGPTWFGAKHTIGKLPSHLRSHIMKTASSVGREAGPNVRTFQHISDRIDDELGPMIRAGRVSEDYVTQTKHATMLQSIFADESFVYEALRKVDVEPTTVKKILDDAMQQRVGTNFEQYLEFVKNFSRETGVFQDHYLSLKNLSDSLVDSLTREKARQILTVVEETSEMIKKLRQLQQKSIPLSSYDVSDPNIQRTLSDSLSGVRKQLLEIKQRSENISIETPQYIDETLRTLQELELDIRDLYEQTSKLDLAAGDFLDADTFDQFFDRFDDLNLEGVLKTFKGLIEPARTVGFREFDAAYVNPLKALDEAYKRTGRGDLDEMIELANSRMDEVNARRAENFARHFQGDKRKQFFDALEENKVGEWMEDYIPSRDDPFTIEDFEDFRHYIETQIDIFRMKESVDAGSIVLKNAEDQDILEGLLKIKEHLDAVPTQTHEATHSAVQKWTQYTLMQSRANNTATFLGDEDLIKSAREVQDFFEDLINNGSQEMPAEVLDLYEEMLGRITAHNQYLHLLTEFQAAPELELLFPHIFDTLQNYNRYDISRALSREHFMADFMDKIHGQLSSAQIDKSYALDKMFADSTELNRRFEAWLKDIGATGHAHDASYDVLRTRFALENVPGLRSMWEKIDREKYIPIIWDSETTGVRGGVNDMLQIAWESEGGLKGNIRLKPTPGQVPARNVTLKLLGLPEDSPLTDAQLFEQFTDRFGEGAGQAEGALQFIEDIKRAVAAANPPGSTLQRKPLLVGWNNKRFDDEFLRKHLEFARPDDVDLRRQLYEARLYFREIDTFDGLRTYHRADGITTLTDMQEHKIKEILGGYIRRRADTIAASVHYPSNLLSYLNSEYADNLRLLQQAYNSATGARGTIPQIMEAQSKVYGKLRDIRETNEALSFARVNKIGDQILDAPDGVQNVTQLMMDGVNQYAPYALKKTIATDDMARFFTEDFMSLSDVELEDFYGATRSMIRIGDKIRNTEFISEDYETLSAVSKELIAFYKKISKNKVLHKKMFDYYNPDTLGTFDRAAMSIRVFEDVKHYSNRMGYDYEFSNLVHQLSRTSPDFNRVLKRLMDPRDYYSPFGRTGFEESFTSHFFQLHMSERMAGSKQYFLDLEARTKDIDNRLRDLSILTEKNNIATASAQAESRFLRELRGFWTKTIEYIRDAGDQRAIYARSSRMEESLKKFIDQKAKAELRYLTDASPQFLEEHLWMAHGRLTFGLPFQVNTRDEVFMQGVFKSFTDRAAELKRHHINVRYDKGTQQMYLYLDNTPEYIRSWTEWEKGARRQALDQAARDGTPVRNIWEDHLIEFEPLEAVDLPREIRESFEGIHRLATDFTHGRNAGSLGEMMNLQSLKDIDAMAPPDLRHKFIDPDVFHAAGHFKGMNFNRTNIGLIGSRRKLMQRASGNIIKNYMNSLQSLAPMMDSRHKFMQLFFDPVHRLKGDFFSDIPPEEMFKALQNHPEIRMAALVNDPKFGSIVQPLNPRTFREFQMIMDNADLDPTLLSLPAFTEAYKHINDVVQVGGSIGKFFKDNVVLPMKVGYLTSMGFIFRNIVDTMFKNVILAGSPTDGFRMVKHTLETGKYYKYYNDIMEEIIKRSPTEQFSYKAMQDFYDQVGHSRMSRELFQQFHDFIQQGPSAGLSKFQADSLKKAYKASKQALGEDTQDKLMFQIVNNPVSRTVMDANSHLEQIFRIAGYTWELEHGATIDQAMQSIFKHHFDYTLKSKAELYLEYAVPFTTFTTQNTAFWMDQLDTNGWVLSVLNDFYKPTWNFQGRDKEDLERNRSIQYNILAGNIIGDDNLTIKLNASVLDAVRLLTNPQEGISRLAPYLRIPIDSLDKLTQDDPDWEWGKTLLTNIPMLGPAFYRYWDLGGWRNEQRTGEPVMDYARIGSALKAFDRVEGDPARYLPLILPSIFGAVADTYARGRSRLAPRPRTVPSRARAIYTPKTFPAYGRKARRQFASRTYHRSSKRYPQRGYYRKNFHSKSYVPAAYDQYAQHRIMSAARGRSLRMPSRYRNQSRSAPALQRKAHAGSGTTRFNVRMVPVNAERIISKMRSDWNYLR